MERTIIFIFIAWGWISVWILNCMNKFQETLQVPMSQWIRSVIIVCVYWLETAWGRAQGLNIIEMSCRVLVPNALNPWQLVLALQPCDVWHVTWLPMSRVLLQCHDVTVATELASLYSNCCFGYHIHNPYNANNILCKCRVVCIYWIILLRWIKHWIGSKNVIWITNWCFYYWKRAS